jgi:uncharacterized protein YyaL (SSP411 family)
MLYDNALLSRVYLHAYQVTGRVVYRQIVEETLDYVLREMTHPNGGCYSSQDADVDGQEGRYYLWTPGEIRQVLGEEDGSLVGRYFGVAEGGNFEGWSVLHAPGDPAGFAAGTGDRLGDVETVMTQARLKLLEARGRRPKPRLDDKMLASWNGLMLQALAEASGVLGREDYLKAAVANASFVVSGLMKGNAMMHSYKDGVSGIPGYLEDYASVIRGVLCLHEATFEQCWLQTAFDLADAMVRRFSDEKNPGYLYDTGPDQSRLFIRPRDTSDSVKPCGGSSAAEALLRISRITGDASYGGLAGAMLGLVRDQMLAHPLASGNWLCALDFHLSDPLEVVVLGRRDDPNTKALLAALNGHYLPKKVLVGFQPGGPVSPLVDNLANGRGMVEGRPTAYVCSRRTCHPPATDPERLARLLHD